jgi:hypothetical protein
MTTLDYDLMDDLIVDELIPKMWNDPSAMKMKNAIRDFLDAHPEQLNHIKLTVDYFEKSTGFHRVELGQVNSTDMQRKMDEFRAKLLKPPYGLKDKPTVVKNDQRDEPPGAA